jgi:hypothetical protein
VTINGVRIGNWIGRNYCTVMAVLVGITDYASCLSTGFYCRLHCRYYNRSVTNSSLANCVDHSLFLSTLLTVDYFRWRPTIHCRLSALVVSSLANRCLTSSSVPLFFQLPPHCLKKGLAGPKWWTPSLTLHICSVPFGYLWNVCSACALRIGSPSQYQR